MKKLLGIVVLGFLVCGTTNAKSDSLPWNKFDNNVSKLLENVVKKSISK